MIQLHACDDPKILDATWGRGRMWRGLDQYTVVSNDVNPDLPADYHHDFRRLPDSWSSSFDVVIFDPPGITEAGVGSRYYGRFGVEMPELKHRVDNTYLFAPFLTEAARVLRPKGIVLAKVGDQVHRGHYRHQFVDYINAVRAQPGLTACDVLIKSEERADSLTGHNWTNVHHTRRAHIYFVVARKGRC